ncbi:MAG: PAS domain S-box protein [Desulfobaccales bacterium]
MKLIPHTYNWEGWAQRALALIRGCHLALAQADQEQPFLQEICRLLVEIGGYSLAWVGIAEKNKGKRISRVAHAGMALGLLDLLPRTWAETETGDDPTAAAIRTRQAVFCPDIQSEPGCAAYSEVAETLGLTSCLALPLIHQDQVLGALTVYSTGPGAFSADEREFLRNLAAFFCQGLTALRLKGELNRVEKRLAFKTQIIESSPYAIFVFDLEGRIICGNESACRARGISREELLSLSWQDLEAPEFREMGAAQRQKLVSAGEGELVFESAHRRQDGTCFPVENHCRLVDFEGRKSILSIVLDISERKQLETVLRETEERYRNIFDNAQVGIFRWRLSDGRMLECNARFVQMLGYSGKDDLLREFAARDQFAEPDTLERMLESVKNGYLQNFETRCFRQDGSVVWLLCSARFYEDRDYLEGVATDITELRLAQDSLKHSEAQHRNLVEQLLGRTLLFAVEQQQLHQEIQREKDFTEKILGRSEEGVAGFDQDFVLTVWNPAMERFTGLPKAAALGKNLFRVLPFLQELDAKSPLLGSGGRRGLLDQQHPVKLTPAGPEGFYAGQVAPLLNESGEVSGGVLIIRDLTAAKRVETALKTQQSLLEGVMASVEEGIAILDRNLTFVRINPTIEKWFAHDLPLVGKTCYAVIHGTLDPCENCPALRTLVSGEPAHQVTSKWGPDTTEAGKVDLFSYPLKDPRTGDTVGVILRILDLSAKLTTEETLKENHERLKLVLHNLPVVLGRLYPDGTADFLEDNVEQLTGYSSKEFAPGGRPWTEVILEEDQEQVRKAFLHALGTDRTYVRQYRIRSKAGRLIWLQESGQITCDAQGRALYSDIVLLDITERKQAEEMRPQFEAQLRQAQRMDAIGSLAGGIAHDFNNILGVMLGYTEMALMSLKEDDGLKRRLQQVLKAGKRGKELVAQILSFSRPSPQERKPVHLSAVIKETLNMLRATLPATIELKMRLEEDQDVILADSTQMHQVIINMCANAAHAMREKGGVLEISLKPVNLDAKAAAHFHGLSPGPHVRLSVKDTGHGMDRDTLEKIFDPFFTTKKMEEGTGMGLAVVHGIIKAHKGAITVQSKVGKGSEFQIYLPRVEAAAVPGGVEAAVVENGQERLLFVDDEEWLVDMWKEILESLGYRMTVTTKPLEALRLFQERPGDFDLVILDQTMPQMTGLELAQELIAVRPQIPIILVTGFSQLVTPEKAKKAGIREYIMKPLSISELTNAISKALGKNSRD